NARFAGARIKADAKHVTIDTGAMKLEYAEDGRAFDRTNLKVWIHGRDKAGEWRPGDTNSENLGGTERTLDGWDGAKQKLSDGVLSRDGWYLLDDSHSVLFQDNWVAARPANSGSDWYLFGYGHDYLGALKSLTAISGDVPMPRRYALGVWYSRYWPYTSAQFRQIVDQYRQHDFPLDVIVMDMDWHLTTVPGLPGNQVWTGYTWDRKLLPDAEDLLKWFHQQGLAVTLNDHPADGVRPHETAYTNFMETYGADPASRETVPFDAGSRKYLDAFFDSTHLPLQREGVNFWWLDWQQFPNTRSVPEISNLAALNEYYFERSTSNGLRGLSFSRWAGWGDQRHPIHFSGDASTAFRMLAFEVPFTSTAGNVGCFFWSHDIGGHVGARNEESYTRWCQFGAFSAALRSHSSRNAELDRRPWTYSDWAEASMKISFQLRSKFFPYIYSSVHESCANSIPLLRPMYLEYPDKNAAYQQPQQYLYGDNVLVAPIASAGAGPRRLAAQVVWFPKGDWFNYFSGEKFSGEHERLVAATIDEFPLYVRGGVPLPMQPFTQRMATAPLTNLVIRCYPGESGTTGSFNLYEDDGLTPKYERGEFAETLLTYRREHDHVIIEVAPTHGNFAGQADRRRFEIELPCTQKASLLSTNDTTATVEYDESHELNRLVIPERSIRDGFSV
ncbi:MAG TPA: TIM-barrel domain-containing protein, partial [Verrucomicrobiae bacterium]|nr:TIM-barrel domain-containing protein [Verrucomicrobiae bacterium]